MESLNLIRKNNLLYKFNNELESIDNNDYEFDFINERVSLLRNVIKKYNNNFDFIDKNKNKNKNNNNNKNKLLVDVLSCMYKKKWHKINNKGKLILINKFLKKKKVKNRTQILKKLYIYLENDDNFSDYIDYDDKKGFINNINILKFNKDKDSYFINI